MITTHPNPDGTANENGGSNSAARAPFDGLGPDREARSPQSYTLAWDGQAVAQLRPFHQEWEGLSADGWELMTYKGLHLSALEPQTLIDELSDRIEVKLGRRPPLVSERPANWEQIKERR